MIGNMVAHGVERAVYNAGKHAKPEEHAEQEAAQAIARANTALAKRKPQYIVNDTLDIQSVDLNAQLPAVDSSLLLKYIATILTMYARFEKVEDVITIALWIASTWFVEPSTDKGMINGQLMFESHPRLFVIAQKGSGKNRLMKIVRNLVRNPTVIGSGVVTSYGVRNALEAGMTGLIDEYHQRTGATGRKQSDLQELILTSYTRESGSIDGKGGSYNEHRSFGPVMLAAQPSILTGLQGENLSESGLFERSLIIPMPKWNDPDDPIPDLDEEYEQKCSDLREALELWGAGLYEMMAGRKSMKYTQIHSMPKNLTGRQREIAIPLFAVADRAINPDKFQEKGEDTEWAEWARNAVLVNLTGRGNNAKQIMSNLAEKFGEPTFTFK